MVYGIAAAVHTEWTPLPLTVEPLHKIGLYTVEPMQTLREVVPILFGSDRNLATAHGVGLGDNGLEHVEQAERQANSVYDLTLLIHTMDSTPPQWRALGTPPR